jgi:hypothetical protein
LAFQLCSEFLFSIYYSLFVIFTLMDGILCS